MLKNVKMTNVGPAPTMEFDFGDRLNLLTGDNGLGKSFLLDIAWWALTRCSVRLKYGTACQDPRAGGYVMG